MPEAKDEIRVFAPATVANVACAFDVLGFAVSNPGDVVTLRRSAAPGIRITRIEGDGGKLPLETEKNTAAVALTALIQQLGSSQGFEIELVKNLPLGSGMGSSAASAAAAVFAANQLLGSPFSVEELVPFAMEGERMACGTAHADNVAPALLGDFVLIRSYQPLDIVRLAAPSDLFCVLVHPKIEIRTEDARRILKKQVLLADAVKQWGNSAALIAGLLQGDYGLIGRSLDDVIIEPERSILIPGFKQVKSAALENGALGCSISGSGPSLFALCRGQQTADAVAKVMQAEFQKIGVESQLFVSAVNKKGCVIVEEGNT